MTRTAGDPGGRVRAGEAPGAPTWARQVEPVPVAVFASGAGSNFRRLCEAAAAGELGAGRVALLVSDRPACGAVEQARRLGVPAFARTHRADGGRAAWEAAALERLRESRIELVVLAGYMRLVGETLLSAYGGRIINIHPSLLPHFPGLNAVGQALAAGAAETGVTVHFVDEGMDTGPVIAQAAVPVRADDTEESLLARVHAAEHRLLPAVVRDLCARARRADGPQAR